MADAAPLVATPTAPIPAGGAAEWVAGAGGTRLRAALFAPPGKPRGSVVLSPGRSEYIEKYFEVVGELLARGFVVLVHDWRGQGLSHRDLADQSLGHARGYADFVEDHALLLAAFEDRMPRPWIAVGHSMGGCLGLAVLACGETRFAAAIFSAPMLALRLGAMPRAVGRALAATLTTLGRAESPFMRAGPPETFESNILTHDRARWARSQAQVAACPALTLGPPTWGWVDFAFSAIAFLERGPGTPAIAIPVIIASAGSERLIDNAGQHRVAARLPHGRLVTVEGAYHEILMETDPMRAVFWKEFDTIADVIAG